MSCSGMFRGGAVSDPKAALRAAAGELLKLLADFPELPLRVTQADGRVACMIQVWDATRVMPTVRRGERVGCKKDILDLVREAGRPLTRKEVVKAFRGRHGPGTVAKALADLTSAGELMNPKDKRGYRMPEWAHRPGTPSLFG